MNSNAIQTKETEATPKTELKRPEERTYFIVERIPEPHVVTDSQGNVQYFGGYSKARDYYTNNLQDGVAIPL